MHQKSIGLTFLVPTANGPNAAAAALNVSSSKATLAGDSSTIQVLDYSSLYTFERRQRTHGFLLSFFLGSAGATAAVQKEKSGGDGVQI